MKKAKIKASFMIYLVMLLSIYTSIIFAQAQSSQKPTLEDVMNSKIGGYGPYKVKHFIDMDEQTYNKWFTFDSEKGVFYFRPEDKNIPVDLHLFKESDKVKIEVSESSKELTFTFLGSNKKVSMPYGTSNLEKIDSFLSSYDGKTMRGILRIGSSNNLAVNVDGKPLVNLRNGESSISINSDGELHDLSFDQVPTSPDETSSFSVKGKSLTITGKGNVKYEAMRTVLGVKIVELTTTGRDIAVLDSASNKVIRGSAEVYDVASFSKIKLFKDSILDDKTNTGFLVTSSSDDLTVVSDIGSTEYQKGTNVVSVKGNSFSGKGNFIVSSTKYNPISIRGKSGSLDLTIGKENTVIPSKDFSGTVTSNEMEIEYENGAIKKKTAAAPKISPKPIETTATKPASRPAPREPIIEIKEEKEEHIVYNDGSSEHKDEDSKVVVGTVPTEKSSGPAEPEAPRSSPPEEPKSPTVTGDVLKEAEKALEEAKKAIEEAKKEEQRLGLEESKKKLEASRSELSSTIEKLREKIKSGNAVSIKEWSDKVTKLMKEVESGAADVKTREKQLKDANALLEIGRRIVEDASESDAVMAVLMLGLLLVMLNQMIKGIRR